MNLCIQALSEHPKQTKLILRHIIDTLFIHESQCHVVKVVSYTNEYL